MSNQDEFWVDPPPPSAVQARLAVLTTLAPDRLVHLLSGDPERAEPWVRAAAEAGLAEGQVRYGRMLLEGEGVEKDPVAAARWFERAARGGDPEAQNMLGRCLENGWGVALDARRAADWFTLAADQGHAWALYNLGHLYLAGLGVSDDKAKALRLYRDAAQLGHVRAMNLVGRCREEGWGGARNLTSAQAWYRRSAEGGYFRGQYNLAALLAEAGRTAEAARWFEKVLAGAPRSSLDGMIKTLLVSGRPQLQRLARTFLDRPLDRALSPQP